MTITHLIMTAESDSSTDRVATGTRGLDEILSGGLIRGQPYLIVGRPGTGKTTLALQFAIEGARLNESVLYITLSQTSDALHQVAESHSWSLEGIDLREPYKEDSPPERMSRQHAIHPADVELAETVDSIWEIFEEVRPDRFVLDSVGVLRTLSAGQPHRYHSEVSSLVRRVQRTGTTSVIVGPTDAGVQDDRLSSAADAEVHMLFHGSIRLAARAPTYGAVRRSIQIEKGRGQGYHSGWHNCSIRRGGLEVFPRLNVTLGFKEAFQSTTDIDMETPWQQMKSGVPELDKILGGGLEFGTTALIVGSTGTGKSTLSLLYTYAALEQGRKAAVFLFTERPDTYARRSRTLNMDISKYLASGDLHLQTVDVGELTPGGLADQLREVVGAGAEVVVIDSLTGYHHAMRDEELLQVQMHDMLHFMAAKGVLAMLVVDQHGLAGGSSLVPVDVSYMCDSLIVLRNYDERGRIRRALAVVKKRYGKHDMTVREMEITDDGLDIGKPRPDLAGVLSGSPTIVSRLEENGGREEGVGASGGDS